MCGSFHEARMFGREDAENFTFRPSRVGLDLALHAFSTPWCGESMQRVFRPSGPEVKRMRKSDVSGISLTPS